MASRHLSRIRVLQALFAGDIRGDLSYSAVSQTLKDQTAALPHDDEDASFLETLLRGVVAKREEIDEIIKKAAPQWPLEKIAVMDRTILRIGLFELLFGTSSAVPPKVALNEAIELAKSFGGESSSRFVNGVLGAVYREMGSPRKEEAPKAAPMEKEYLAGIVVCAKHHQTLYVALVRDPFNMWTLPKTHYRKGELSDVAALRAATEELGIRDVSIVAPIGEHEYEAHDPDHGTVMRRVGYFVACTKKQSLRAVPEGNARAAKWFAEEELAGMPLYDDLRALISSGMVVAHAGCSA